MLLKEDVIVGEGAITTKSLSAGENFELPVPMSIWKRQCFSDMPKKLPAGDFFGAEGFPALGGSVIATDDGEMSAVYCECSDSVGVKRERQIRLSSL